MTRDRRITWCRCGHRTSKCSRPWPRTAKTWQTMQRRSTRRRCRRWSPGRRYPVHQSFRPICCRSSSTRTLHFRYAWMSLILWIVALIFFVFFPTSVSPHCFRNPTMWCWTICTPCPSKTAWWCSVPRIATARSMSLPCSTSRFRQGSVGILALRTGYNGIVPAEPTNRFVEYLQPSRLSNSTIYNEVEVFYFCLLSVVFFISKYTELVKI